ncbi:MAG: DUF1987 domain-containing protein [Putridiphycobacter sp.]
MSLQIKATVKTPQIELVQDKGYILIEGISIPEDPQEFFQPLDDELNKYIKNPAESTKLVFKLEYFNTSTTLVIRNIIRKLRDEIENSNLKVEWYFEEEDEDMQEAGEEFKILFEELDFEIIGVNSF